MKPKIFKIKSIIAIGIGSFYGRAMLFAALPGAKADSATPVLSVVPTGAPGATGTTMIAVQLSVQPSQLIFE